MPWPPEYGNFTHHHQALNSQFKAEQEIREDRGKTFDDRVMSARAHWIQARNSLADASRGLLLLDTNRDGNELNSADFFLEHLAFGVEGYTDELAHEWQMRLSAGVACPQISSDIAVSGLVNTVKLQHTAGSNFKAHKMISFGPYVVHDIPVNMQLVTNSTSVEEFLDLRTKPQQALRYRAMGISSDGRQAKRASVARKSYLIAASRTNQQLQITTQVNRFVGEVILAALPQGVSLGDGNVNRDTIEAFQLDRIESGAPSDFTMAPV